EDDVEFGLLFGFFSRSGGGTTSGRASAHHHRRGGGNAPLLFEQSLQLGSFEDGQRAQVFDKFVQVSHSSSPLCSGVYSVGWCLGCGFAVARIFLNIGVQDVDDLGRGRVEQARQRRRWLSDQPDE